MSSERRFSAEHSDRCPPARPRQVHGEQESERERPPFARTNSCPKTRLQRQPRWATCWQPCRATVASAWLVSPRYGLSVRRVVVQLNFSAGALLRGINDATVEGTRIHMQADGPLAELPRVDHAMHRLPRITRARLRNVHLQDVSGLELTAPGAQVLANHAEIFHLQTPDGRRHPAVLVPMVMHRTGLADLPADGQQFVERSFIDQITRVMLPIPG